MNRRSLFIAVVFIATFYAISALAQVPAAPPKIAFINTEAFYDDKAGITKLVTATKQLDAEFATQIKALEDGNTKLQGIAKELETMQKLPQAQFNQVAYTQKQDEGERLQRELTYKKTELESAYGKRRDALIGPISQDIGKGIDEFSKKNGYGVVLDISKLAQALLYFGETAEVTKEFITFYNARPAAATTPK